MGTLTEEGQAIGRKKAAASLREQAARMLKQADKIEPQTSPPVGPVADRTREIIEYLSSELNRGLRMSGQGWGAEIDREFAKRDGLI